MKLVWRVTASLFIFLTLSSSAIGYFAITKYQSSQLNVIDDSLNSKVSALVKTKEDPLTVAQYLAQVSAIPVTAQFVAANGVATDLTVGGPAIGSMPNKVLLEKARHTDENFGTDLRIRTFQMTNDQKIILAESLSTLNSEVSVLKSDLISFIALVDLVALIAAFLIFRRDGKLNEVSNLIAQQKNTMQRFLGDASHELRTPLTVVKGYVDLARKSDDEEKTAGYLAKSSTEILRMEALISDLLFLAEVGESEIGEIEEVDLRQLINEQIEILSALQPERSISSTCEGGVTFNAEAKLIHRLISNIFSNIRKHTPDNAPVAVALKGDGNEVSITVEDGGAGFAHWPDKSRLHRRFSPERSSEGTGLGLSIIAGIVERHQGSLHYSRSSLGGVKVEITFPKSS
jgi:signal transduction histidine kinase